MHESLIKINNQVIRIEYTTQEGIHLLGLLPRPFEAIKLGLKKVEYRTNTQGKPFDYSIVQVGDRIKFLNELTGDTLLTQVNRVSHYTDARSLYETEGLSNSSSNPSTIDEAIERLTKLNGYEEGIKENGIYAFELEVIDQ